jgi:23S rRNA (cytidine1920-2'-O)/16S rRNA (cytidine1409-2'-O)-methyltransferase
MAMYWSCLKLSKVRLDVLVHQRALAASREKARVMIQAGLIMVNGQRIDKPGSLVAEESAIEIHGTKPPYVSRGGLKLEKALQDFAVDLRDKVLLDVGASTGGYTDCALQNGAQRVYAVDVGYGQLDWSLRNDPRVINLERTNIRYLSKNELPEAVDVVTIDVSFISTRLVFPAIIPFLKRDGQIIALIKPQFETGREKVGKKGVVRDAAVHLEVLGKVLEFAQWEGLHCHGLTFSPLKGPQGNIEFFMLLKPLPDEADVDWESVAVDVVQQAHQQLEK